MRHRAENTMRVTRESGFALVLAILALVLLTFLGLTLAVTTSTELQIASNYRWSQQALYNAEAGIEAAKALLRDVDWATVLPAARQDPAVPTWDGKTPPADCKTTLPTDCGGVTATYARKDEWNNNSRNFENWSCDERFNGIGYGVVLDDGGAEAPFQYKTTLFGQALNGAVTLWVRRPLKYRVDGTLEDYSFNDKTLILVAEGIAPYAGATGGTAFGKSRSAVQVIEVTLTAGTTEIAGNCEGRRAAQTGGGQFGANFGGCAGIGDGTAITGALGGAVTGPGTEIDKNK